MGQKSSQKGKVKKYFELSKNEKQYISKFVRSN